MKKLDFAKRILGTLVLYFFLQSLTLAQRASPSPEIKKTKITPALVHIPKIYSEINLSKKDWNFVEKGKTLYRPPTKDCLGGTGITLVKSPPWKVWQVITDYPKYREFMPRNVESTILLNPEKNSNPNILTFRSVYRSNFASPKIWSVSQIEHDTSNPENLVMVWDAQKTNLKYNHGFWNLKPHGSDTLVIYSNEFEISWIPNILAKGAVKKSILQTLAAVKIRVQNPRYAQKPGKLVWVWDQNH